MVPAVEVLHHDEGLSLHKMRAPEQGVGGYTFSHETRCGGQIVAVLPFTDDGPERHYVLRREVTPCWSMDPVSSAVTGGWEGGDIADDAVREVAEETGYAITTDDLIPLGESYASKSADTVYTLYAVDVTGRQAGEFTGDGSELEASADTVTVTVTEMEAVSSMDPQVSVMVGRLRVRDVFAATYEAVTLAESDCACGQPVDVEGDVDADGDQTVYVEDIGFWHRACWDQYKRETQAVTEVIAATEFDAATVTE